MKTWWVVDNRVNKGGNMNLYLLYMSNHDDDWRKVGVVAETIDHAMVGLRDPLRDLFGMINPIVQQRGYTNFYDVRDPFVGVETTVSRHAAEVEPVPFCFDWYMNGGDAPLHTQTPESTDPAEAFRTALATICRLYHQFDDSEIDDILTLAHNLGVLTPEKAHSFARDLDCSGPSWEEET